MKKDKLIFIVNGSAGVGKDTFAEYLDEFTNVYKYSSIDCVKNMALVCGWDGVKDDKSRKFLSDLKFLTSDFNDFSFRSIKKHVEMFLESPDYVVMLIDIREPEEIEKAVKEFGAETILIRSLRAPFVTSNEADRRVLDYWYDYILDNNGTLEEFRNTVKDWWYDQVSKLVFF